MSVQTIAFKQAFGSDISLDYYPPPPGAALPAPVLFSVHGGGGSGGDRKDVRLWSFALARARGYAIVSPDYRLIPECDAPAIAKDVSDAWNFVTAGELNKKLGKEEVDVKRAVLLGISAGGWSSTLIGARAPVRPAAYINLYGTWSLLAGDWGKPAVKPMVLPGIDQATPFLLHIMSEAKAGRGKPTTGSYLNIFQMLQTPREQIEALVQANGISLEDFKAYGLDGVMTQEEIIRNLLCPYSVNTGVLEAICEGPDGNTPNWAGHPKDPTPLIDAKFPPTLTLHGTGDSLVPFHVSETFDSILKSHGVKSELVPYPDQDHMFDLAWHPHLPDFAKITGFLDSVGA
ncbi:KYNURENINE FORMAMIDASE [Ceraceosorus bombacis]|uniref:KYNURENINE FORMAMIDASE n=1 Tax=Ceraceosorus bombacis TaxID=401625 RepID=A0A0P1BNQ4_9BASI|nr:KYNURENINE FORMAMIDASE [Ceraceosorus bombacis]